MRYVIAYLLAVVFANLAVAAFGPSVTILDAFIFIALDLTARDKLHDAWEHKGLVWKMALLIASGSIISYLLNRNAGQIALASFCAFALANIADTLSYQLLHKYPRIFKVNGSNVISAGVDSFVFPVLAFGWPPLWFIILGQFAAKVAGGFIWSFILGMHKEPKKIEDTS